MQSHLLASMILGMIAIAKRYAAVAVSYQPLDSSSTHVAVERVGGARHVACDAWRADDCIIMD
jgi:hypothetical protein